MRDPAHEHFARQRKIMPPEPHSGENAPVGARVVQIVSTAKEKAPTSWPMNLGAPASRRRVDVSSVERQARDFQDYIEFRLSSESNCISARSLMAVRFGRRVTSANMASDTSRSASERVSRMRT